MPDPKPLSEYAFDELLDALIAGQAFELPQLKQIFELSADSRCTLAFYRATPRYWVDKTLVREDEVAALLDALKAGKIPSPRISGAGAATIRKWRLRKVTAHRFAGLHRHCNAADGSAPPDFEWEVDRDISLVLGGNGAGKSSMLSAISWVLTGRAIRSQSDPEEVHDPMDLILPSAEGEEAEGKRQLLVPPVVPVPTAAELTVLNDAPVVDDTWVKLEFVPVEGGPAVEVSRSLSERRGKISAPDSGLDRLGLSQTALEVGTIMPAVAAQMRFDQPTQLGKAIAELTGMKPFSEFGKRIPRVIDRLEGKEVRETKAEMTVVVERFLTGVAAYLREIEGLDQLQPPNELTAPDIAIEPNCRARLLAAREAARAAAKGALDGMRALLGVAPKLDKGEIGHLLKAVSAAEAKLAPSELAVLPTARDVLRPISKGGQDADAVQREIDSILDQARWMAERLEKEAAAKRWQLYVRVVQWHEHHHPGQSLDVCPVCGSDLDGVPKDALLDLAVREAFDEARRSGKELAKTAEEWVADRAQAFLAKLPPTIRSLMEHDWRAGVTPLYARAIAQELLGQSEFKGTLQPLAARAKELWGEVEADLPEWTVPAPVSLPGVFPKESALETQLNQAAVVTAVIRFRAEHKAAFEGVFSRVLGKATDEAFGVPSDEEGIAKLPLASQLALLRQAARAALPAAEAGGKVDALIALADRWGQLNGRLVMLDRAAKALQSFTQFPALIEGQVEGLLKELEADTKLWVRRIYRSSFLEAPGFAGIKEEGGILGLRVSIGGVVAPAHQVLNASALRAHVWGFLFALWKRVWEKQGGLSLMLLDDPQQLFDPQNAELLASAVPSLLPVGMNPILASNDDHFVEMVKLYLRVQEREDRASFLYISPISSSNLGAYLAPQWDAVERSRFAWQANKDDMPTAQAFIRDVRSHVETRLRDLLTADRQILDRDATLADFIARIGELRRQGQPPFDLSIFQALVSLPQLQKGHAFYDCANQALHSRARHLGPADAAVMAEDFDDVIRTIDICAQTYARFMGRLPAEDVRATLSPAFQPLAPRAATLSQTLIELPAMAARISIDAISEATDGNAWGLAEIGEVALYAIGVHSLGLACRVGQTAIVDLTSEAKPGDLVIALNGKRAFARRLACIDKAPDLIALEAVPAAGKVPPTLVLPRHFTRVMKVIGVLYDRHAAVGGEAKRVEVSEALKSVRFVAPVIDDSAYPAIPDGSRILLSPVDSHVQPAEALSTLEGQAVAVAVTASPDAPGYAAGYLKRLGLALPGYPAIRVLENIGVASGGLHVHFPALGEAPSQADIPTVRQIWRVSGVLFP